MFGFKYFIGDPALRQRIRLKFERVKTIVFYATLILLVFWACFWTGYLLRLASGV